MDDKTFKKIKSSLQVLELLITAGGKPQRLWEGFDPRKNCDVIEKKSPQRSVLLTYCNSIFQEGHEYFTAALEVGVEKHQSVCMALGLRDWKRMDRLSDVGGNHVDFVTDFVEDGVPALAFEEFDLVVCSNTLEHTFDISKGFDAVFNMAQPGGLIYFSMPFMVEEHGDEHDYWRMTPACMAKMMEGRARDYVVLREQFGTELLGVSCFALK